MMDDNAPLPEKPLDLERLSVEELEARMLALSAEIEACKVELEKKRTHKSAADALFGSDG